MKATSADALLVAAEHLAWAMRPAHAGGGDLTRREVAEGIGRKVPAGLEPEPSTLVRWLASAWLEAIGAARRNAARNAVTVRNARRRSP
jgi:hypothetical protein